MTAAEADAGLRGGALVAVDVREVDEFEAGHIAGSQLLPLSELAARVAELPDGRMLMVCRTGSRSGMAADALVEAGYDAVNLVGGMYAWVGAGLPIEPQGGFVA